jgi:hypothetical protein
LKQEESDQKVHHLEISSNGAVSDSSDEEQKQAKIEASKGD